MLNFFIRFLIIILSIIICLGFSSAFLSIPFVLSIIFVCSWVFVKSFQKVFLEIIIFAFIYDFLTAHHIGVYFFIIIIFAFIYDFLKRFVFEVSGSRFFLAYFGMIFLVSSVVLFNFFQKNVFDFWLILKQILNYSLISVFFFFLFSKVIYRLEEFISFYTQKINVKRHI